MARKKRNPKVDSRTARADLRVRAEPYWTVIEKGRAIGYRKGKNGGSWIARFRGTDGKQHYQSLGASDDTMDPDGHSILSFAQAQAAARDWFEDQAHAQVGGHRGPYTVRDCIEDYIAHMKSEGKPSAYDWDVRAKAHIIPKLGEVDTKDLSSKQIRSWRDKLAASPARLRTRPNEEQQFRTPPATENEVRQRKVTANRTLTILKAGLNLAFGEGKITSDLAWRRVAPFKGVEAARVRSLTLKECKRLINASAPEFRPVVKAALMTGARYGELTALRVHDFNSEAGTIFVAMSKNKKPRHVVLTDEGSAFFEAITAKRTDRDASLLLRNDKSPWGRSHQGRRLTAACENGKVNPSITFHELRHTYASLSIMAGMTLMVLAGNLGHSDTRMVEKHYGHLADTYRADMIRRTAPVFGVEEAENVQVIG